MMMDTLQVATQLTKCGFNEEQAQGLTVILNENRAMLVTQSDMTDAINMLSQRIDQAAAQLVQMEKNNIARFEQMQENMTVRFEAMNDRFDAINKQISGLRWFQGISIAFMAALIAINMF